MIFALRQPPIFVGLLAGFLVGVVLRSAAQEALNGPRRLRVAGRTRIRRPWSARIDPYGAVAAILSGVGWGPRPDVRRRGRRADWQVTVAAVAVHAVLAVAGFAAFVAAGGLVLELNVVSVSSVLHGSGRLGTAAQEMALGFGMENLACGLLALVPIPPLEAGLVVWSRVPRSPRARRFSYHLLEEQWGVAVLLVLLLLPLAGELPAILMLINTVGHAILHAV